MLRVFTNAKTPITNESVNFLAQSYYDDVRINGRYALDPGVFTQRASLGNIATKEIALLATMYRGSTMVKTFIDEIKRRS